MPIVTDPWTRPIQDEVGNRAGNSFARVGMTTLADVKRAIEYHQIYYAEGKFVSFTGTEAPTPRRAGPKTWKTVLDRMEELGFNWRAHIYRFKGRRAYTAPTKEQQRAEIEEAIVELKVLLKRYLEAIAND